MQIDTYFGFFAQAVFTAIASSLAAQTGRPLTLAEVRLSTTNTIKLRQGDAETVLVPSFATPTEVNFVLALAAQDAAALKALAAARRLSTQALLEQAVGAAVEPFNFISKTRNKLTGLQISRNVTGLTAHHLAGEVAYTMAVGRLAGERGRDLSLRLLVTPDGRDRIEERATQANTQRAIFSINEGAYVCRPQWEPPPPPPGMEKGTGLSESLLNGWLQTYFALNDGAIPGRMFKRPAAQTTQVVPVGALRELEGQAGGITVVRMVVGEAKEREALVVLPAVAETSLMTLSKSGQSKFLGDFFRAYFSEAAQLWERFAGEPVRWRVVGVGKIPGDALNMVSGRLEGGGLTLQQEAKFDDGRVRWFLGLTGHAWHWLMALTAQAMGAPVEGTPEREAVFRATGWGTAGLPWGVLVALSSERDLQELVRQLTQAKLAAPHMATVTAALQPPQLDRWLEAMPVMLRERAQAHEFEEGEEAPARAAMTAGVLALGRAGRLPEGRLADWMRLHGEIAWARRNQLVERLLPLRHLIYGMDRESLSRLMFDVKNDLVVSLICGAEFPVIDQVRRAISPGFAMRLLEDVAIRRPRATAMEFQEAVLTLYRICHDGLADGRYMLRATPAKRLTEIIRRLDEGA